MKILLPLHNVIWAVVNVCIFDNYLYFILKIYCLFWYTPDSF